MIQNKDRYQQDPLPVRLGNLASNLERIASVSKNPDNWKIVESIMEESKFFIEWNIEEANLNQLIFLAQIQRQLAFWQSICQQIFTNEIECSIIQDCTQRWSKELLVKVGLLV